MLKGETVTLLEAVDTGKDDAFNRPIVRETAVDVANVLIAPVQSGGAEIVDTLNLDGRKAEYKLAIPKTDTHVWAGQRVRFWGQTWEVIGTPTRGIDSLIPGPWNTIVLVEGIHGKKSDRQNQA